MTDLSFLEGKSILITGATGLIGKSVIASLAAWNKNNSKKINIYAVVRDIDKAKIILRKYLTPDINFIISDINEIKPVNMGINYVVHGASQTVSKAFVTEPVETITTALKGTKKVLELAKNNPVEGFVYLSSMEVYGTPVTDEKISEDHEVNLDTMMVRSCYPESKRMCENLCVSFSSEYGVPTKVLRLTQTFGPGVAYHDPRVFAEFARCAIERKDIVLKTKGETKRSYLHVEDAVDAIFVVLKNGTNGQAYNAANEDTYCSIYDMATLVAENYADHKIQVLIDEANDQMAFGYAPILKMNLDTLKLRSIGWKPQYNLYQMFSSMIQYMDKNK